MMHNKANFMKILRIRTIKIMINKIMDKNLKIMMIKKKEEIQNLKKIMKEERRISKMMIRRIQIKTTIKVMEILIKIIS
jgi:hypothetical protein